MSRYTIEEADKNINGCLKAYAIIGKSPFAEKCILRYLTTADKEGLVMNRIWLIRIIENQPANKLEKLIENYLTTFELIEYNDGINLAIQEKIGQPYVSPDWEIYSVELRTKFLQWSFLHQLRIHTLSVPKKYKILEKYIGQVRNSYKIKEENLFIIDFGEIVIADIYDRPYSFFYQKEAFETEMAAWQEDKEKLPAFIRIDKKNLTARDFIIEEIEEPCIKLSYEGIDILYIHEMLDIKMGIEPDMRRKHLAKMMKKGHLKKKMIHLEE